MELMILNAFVSIHISSMTVSLKCVIDKNAKIVQASKVRGHALVVLNMLII